MCEDEGSVISCKPNFWAYCSSYFDCKTLNSNQSRIDGVHVPNGGDLDHPSALSPHHPMLRNGGGGPLQHQTVPALQPPPPTMPTTTTTSPTSSCHRQTSTQKLYFPKWRRPFYQLKVCQHKPYQKWGLSEYKNVLKFFSGIYRWKHYFFLFLF